MFKTDISTTTYTDGEYMIDIVTGDEWYDAWLYRKDIGVKMLMFGIQKEDSTAEELLEMALNDLESYKRIYDEDYAKE